MIITKEEAGISMSNIGVFDFIQPLFWNNLNVYEVFICAF